MSSVCGCMFAAVGATAVYWNRCYEPFAIRRDTAIKSALEKRGLSAKSFNAALLFEGDPLAGAEPIQFRFRPPAGFRPVDIAATQVSARQLRGLGVGERQAVQPLQRVGQAAALEEDGAPRHLGGVRGKDGDHAHAGHYFARAEGFGDVVVGAQLKAAHPVVLLALGDLVAGGRVQVGTSTEQPVQLGVDDPTPSRTRPQRSTASPDCSCRRRPSPARPVVADAARRPMPCGHGGRSAAASRAADAP